jgi:catechol 2,3-dioxygenase-like lactoylglutathione lyase family enzyme
MRRIVSRLILVISAAPAFAQTPDVVVGVGTFIHVVADLDKTIRFYKDRLGLELNGPAGPRAFSSNTVIESLYDATGSQSRVAVFKIGASPLGLEFVEFKGIAQKPFRPGIGDAGASIVTLAVPDVEQLLSALKEDHTEIVSSESGRHIAIVKDPDGFYIQLVRAEAGVAAAKLSLVSADSATPTLHLFRDLLGFQFTGMAAKVPGTQFDVQLMVFKRVGPASQPPSIHDPGAGVLRLQVRNVDTLLQTLRNAKVPVVSVGGNPVDIGGRHFVILRDPDGFFFQLVPQTQNLTAAPK